MMHVAVAGREFDTAEIQRMMAAAFKEEYPTFPQPTMAANGEFPRPRAIGVMPSWNDIISVNCRGMIVRVSLNFYTSQYLGCHSMCIHDISGRVVPRVLTDKDLDWLKQAYGLELPPYVPPKDPWGAASTLSPGREITHQLHRIAFQDNDLSKEIAEGVYKYIKNNMLANKVFYFMSDRVNKTVEGVFNNICTTGFISYMADRGWPVMGTPIAANPNYWETSATLVRGYIMIRPSERGPRIAWDTAFKANFPKRSHTLDDMEEHFRLKRVLGGYPRNWWDMIGNGRAMFARFYKGSVLPKPTDCGDLGGTNCFT